MQRTTINAIAAVTTALAVSAAVVVLAVRDTSPIVVVSPCPSALTGATGASGAPGPSGAPGSTGAPGKKGKTGATGSPGATGPKGEPGLTGATGVPGSQGNTGATGATGAPGVCTSVTGPPGIDANVSRGSFYSTFTEQLTARYAAQPMRLSSTTDSANVSITSSSGNACNVSPYCPDIVISQTGTYNIQFSAQLSKVGVNTYITADIFLSKKGVNEPSWTPVPNTNTRVFVPNDTDYAVAAWNFMEVAESGDQYRLMWSSSDSNWDALRILSGAATGYPTNPPPSIPGLILTVDAVS